MVYRKYSSTREARPFHRPPVSPGMLTRPGSSLHPPGSSTTGLGRGTQCSLAGRFDAGRAWAGQHNRDCQHKRNSRDESEGYMSARSVYATVLSGTLLLIFGFFWGGVGGRGNAVSP